VIACTELPKRIKGGHFMTEEVRTALLIAAIGLPVMLGVIGIFMLLARVLTAAFPHRRDEA